MVRTLAFGLAALVMSHGLAGAQSTGQGSGQYILTQARHKAKVKKVDALTVKQKQTASNPFTFNPKELTVDKPVGRKRKPAIKTLCTSPGGGGSHAC